MRHQFDYSFQYAYDLGGGWQLPPIDCQVVINAHAHGWTLGPISVQVERHDQTQWVVLTEGDSLCQRIRDSLKTQEHERAISELDAWADVPADTYSDIRHSQRELV